MMEVKLKDRDFPDDDPWGHRRGICRRCHLIMVDCEPMQSTGEFYHIARAHQTRAQRCINAGQQFSTDNAELLPFLPKARRRALKRMGIRP